MVPLCHQGAGNECPPTATFPHEEVSDQHLMRHGIGAIPSPSQGFVDYLYYHPVWRHPILPHARSLSRRQPSCLRRLFNLSSCIVQTRLVNPHNLNNFGHFEQRGITINKKGVYVYGIIYFAFIFIFISRIS